MKIVTEQYPVFEFSELPDDVQEDVIHRWRIHDEFFWSSEWQASLREFLRSIPIVSDRHVDWQVDPFGHSYVRIRGADDWFPMMDLDEFDEDTELGWTAEDWKKVADDCENCVFTGYTGDYAFGPPIREALKNAYGKSLDELPRFTEVVQAALQGWLDDYKADLEYWYSAEAVKEDIEVREHDGLRFTSSGKSIWPPSGEVSTTIAVDADDLQHLIAAFENTLLQVEEDLTDADFVNRWKLVDQFKKLFE